jgi:hypothetical protein
MVYAIMHDKFRKSFRKLCCLCTTKTQAFCRVAPLNAPHSPAAPGELKLKKPAKLHQPRRATIAQSEEEGEGEIFIIKGVGGGEGGGSEREGDNGSGSGGGSSRSRLQAMARDHHLPETLSTWMEKGLQQLQI